LKTKYTKSKNCKIIIACGKGEGRSMDGAKLLKEMDRYKCKTGFTVEQMNG
jgi:hypothetical protein